VKQNDKVTSTRIPPGRQKWGKNGKKEMKTKGTPIYRIRHQEQSETINAMHPGNILKDDTRMHGAACYADEGGKTKAEEFYRHCVSITSLHDLFPSIVVETVGLSLSLERESTREALRLVVVVTAEGMAAGRGESSAAVHHVEENAGIDVDVSGTTHAPHASHATHTSHTSHTTEATACKHLSRVDEIIAIVVSSALPI
jgi:hypothetical protein